MLELQISHWSLNTNISIIKQQVWYQHIILMLPCKIFNKHTILDMFCSKWTYCISAYEISGRHGHMVVGFTTIYAISAYHHYHCLV
jgi:hypothetical protein